MNIKDIKLKPCPFCGGEAELKLNGNLGFTTEDPTLAYSVYVYCRNCEARTKNIYRAVNYNALEVAASQWNLRMSRDNNEKG